MQLKFNFITNVKGGENILSKNILFTKQFLSIAKCIKIRMSFKKNMYRDFPGSPVVKTLHFQRRGCGFDLRN